MVDLLTRGDAVISDCGQYRYKLTREWGSGPTCVFIMLNPSTADASEDDPTIRRCISFARREGCGGLTVMNLFAYRATSPDDMMRAVDPVGPQNDEYLRSVLVANYSPIIAGWGAHGKFMSRDKAVSALLGDKLECLGTTKTGQPRHPLYIRSDAPRLPWLSRHSKDT